MPTFYAAKHIRTPSLNWLLLIENYSPWTLLNRSGARANRCLEITSLILHTREPTGRGFGGGDALLILRQQQVDPLCYQQHLQTTSLYFTYLSPSPMTSGKMPEDATNHPCRDGKPIKERSLIEHQHYGMIISTTLLCLTMNPISTQCTIESIQIVTA